MSYLRSLLGVALGLAVILGCAQEETEGPTEIVICSYGGSFQDAQRAVFFTPFTEKTGIKVREANWSGEYAKLKAMVESGQVSWDVVTAAEASIIARGIKEDILAPIDWSRMNRDSYYPSAVTDYSVGTNVFSTVLAFNRLSVAGRRVPENWTDFWDVESFPGRRSLRNDPRTTLEFALLADGVEKDALYPLDIDRAFASLNRIKPHIAVWWTSGHQPAQLLVDREVEYTSAFNGRIWAAAQRDGAPLEVVWAGGAVDFDAFIIPRGTRNFDAAMDFIAFTSEPERQIAFTRHISYGPTIAEAHDRLSQEVLRDLPSSPENLNQQFYFDGEWWAENEQDVLERWHEWLLAE